MDMDRQKKVEEIVIDMNAGNGAAQAFFQGPYEPDYRVKQVLEQTEDEFYQNKIRQKQLDDFYRK